jgi:hypothetical protein
VDSLSWWTLRKCASSLLTSAGDMLMVLQLTSYCGLEPSSQRN